MQQSPVAVGIFAAYHILSVAEADAHEIRQRRVRDIVEALLHRMDWRDEGAWPGVEVCGSAFFAIAAALTSADATAAVLESAVVGNSSTLPWIIRSCAEWTEQRDSRDLSKLLGYKRRYSALPEWFPTAAVVDGIRTNLPDVVARRNPRSDTEEVEALADQILDLAAKA